MLTQTIHVMLSDPGLVKKIEVVQGDTGREIECIVDDMQIPEGATAIICGVKPSMKGFRNSCTVSGQKITAEITNQMDAEEGWTPFQILIQDAGSTVSTFTIVLDVKKSYSGDFPVSENESTWLEEYVEGITEQVNTATENAEAATLNANTATKNANSAADAANAAAEAVEEAVSGVINDNQVSESTTYSSQKLGNFSQLLTTAKNTFVAAINELVLKIGDLKQLATTGKTDIVSAINEIEGGKLNKANVANNLTTTQEGYALDARQGKTLDDKVTQLNFALAINVSAQYNVSIPYGATAGQLYVDWDDVHRIYRIYGWFDIPVTTSVDDGRKYTINLPPDFPKINSDTLLAMGTPCTVQNSIGVIYGAMKLNTNKTIDFYVPHAHIVAVYLQPIFINIP